MAADDAQDAHDLSDGAEIHYSDAALDDLHDDDGIYDDSDEDSRVIYTVAPTWWENLLARVWWQWRMFICMGRLTAP